MYGQLGLLGVLVGFTRGHEGTLWRRLPRSSRVLVGRGTAVGLTSILFLKQEIWQKVALLSQTSHFQERRTGRKPSDKNGREQGAGLKRSFRSIVFYLEFLKIPSSLFRNKMILITLWKTEEKKVDVFLVILRQASNLATGFVVVDNKK